ncbi:TetR family transcriptional regulator [Nocardia arthritidis]|uniref:TetR family transcriptional regulator n=2 Tax=Nocardia arthritidis TaxID=228602 RepID=A0A6G9YA97_9NOCA|nr:TetR family transcriptional regulator [Nocardia arthritidis]
MSMCSNLVKVSPTANRLAVMPRGVAIPAIRQQLFTAAEQLIVRDGPGKLSGRAVTGAAGVATGLMYAHFADFDEFLTGYATDRGFLLCAEAANLPERAGTGGIAANVCEVVLARPLAATVASVRLLAARPDLADRIGELLGDRNAGLDTIESATAAYLSAEQRLGRLPATADPAALALAIVGVVHHLLLTVTAEADIRLRLHRTVAALVGEPTPSEHGSAAR